LPGEHWTDEQAKTNKKIAAIEWNFMLYHLRKSNFPVFEACPSEMR